MNTNRISKPQRGEEKRWIEIGKKLSAECVLNWR